MAPSQEPLLSRDDRPSSEVSSERNIEEEDALLTGESKPSPKYGWEFWRSVALFTWAVAATAVVIILAVMYQHAQSSHPQPSGDDWKIVKPPGKRNLIFMVSDGMGPTSLSLTRSFRQAESGLPIDDVLVLDKYLIGSSRTRSTSSLITDSAAGATAFSCGMKSYNGAISVLPDHSPCGSVLEAAKKAGYMTGLVVTTRITDATPACFAAHVNRREEEDRIAEQEVGDYPLGRVVDLMLGGGRCHFLPNTTKGSCRGDDKNVVEMAKSNGFSYVDDREGFDGLNFGSAINLPLLGLFARTDIPYEIDRRNQNDVYPSLDEMARTALEALSAATADSDKGFFLMIEGSRIDHAGHGNDPVAQVHEVLAYDKAFASVIDFLDRDDTPGVLVGTSDHETGGLATARRMAYPPSFFSLPLSIKHFAKLTTSTIELHATYPEYHWFPTILANATHSAENLAYQLRDRLSLSTDSTNGISTPARSPSAESELRSYIQSELIEKGLGIYDYSDDEVTRLVEHPAAWPASYTFADMISRRAQVGWTTHGHSALDVNIYASSPKDAAPLMGNHENTEIGEFIRDYLDLDMEAVTRELREKGALLQQSGNDWMGAPVDDQRTQNRGDHYEGDFKKRGLGEVACACGGMH